MTHTEFSFLGYLVWTVALLVTIAGYRTWLLQSKKHTSLKFSSDGSDVPEFGQRLGRAHANCVESFVWFGGILLYAMATSKTAITDELALYLLSARIGQSIIHMVSTSALAIQIRFVLFLVQISIVGFWIAQFFSH